MERNKLFPLLFLASFAVTIIGTFMKIQGMESGTYVMIVGLLLWLAWLVMGIIEVVTSDNLDSTEKVMWVVGFIFFGAITGIVYLLLGRKRVLTQRHTTF